MELNITTEELIAEQFKRLNIDPEPAEEDGWVRFIDIVERAPRGWTKTNVRDEYERRLEQGEVEKAKWKGQAYYRIVAPADVQQEDTKE